MLPLTIMRDEWENKYIKYITESYWKKTYMNNFHKIIVKKHTSLIQNDKKVHKGIC